MNNYKMYVKGKRQGLSTRDMAMIQASAYKKNQEILKEAREDAFLFMLAIPLNILTGEYWEKASETKCRKFCEECVKLYKAVENGIVTKEELERFLKDRAGIELRRDE